MRPSFDPDVFFRSSLPDALDANAECIVPALSFIAPRPTVVACDDAAWTLAADDRRVTVTPGAASDAVAHVRFSAEQLGAIVDDQASIMGLWASNALEQTRGQVGHLLDWWLVLRAALDGTPIYRPGAVAFTDADGAPLDLGRSFRPDDDPADMRAFFESAGFLHLQGVFTEDEMRAVSADMDRAAPTYTEGDGRSWWARTTDGNAQVVRMQGFDRESQTTAALIEDARFLALADIPGVGHEFGRKRAHNKIEALFKPLGITEGISDIPWHKDCSLGRHSYDCCSLTVGISVTGADATSGQLRVIAGSHRALVWAGIRQPEVDLPDIPLATRTGDVTMHLSCTMHMAQPPTEQPRRVMYSGFGLPPLESADAEVIAANRARLGAVRESAPLTVLDRHMKS